MGKNMDKELRILILEDKPTDVELIDWGLRKAGIVFTSRHAGTREEFIKSLKDFAPDIILSDYKLPQFDGMAALELTKEISRTVPFIIITGSMNEEIAVECIKSGAADYVLKDRLARLGAAVKGALENKRVREEKERLQEALWTAAREWRATFDTINDLVALMDSEGRLLRCNRAMANLLGKAFNEIVGHKCFQLLHGTSKPIKECPFLRMQKTHGRESLVLPLGDRWFNVAVDPLMDQEGKIVGAVHIMSDITELKWMEEELRALSFVDDLTGLCNRRGFLTLAEQQLKIANRTKDKMLLFFIDLDDMKWINDTLGHLEGDRALREVATILKETFRESDIIARMGGDEFVVLSIEKTGNNTELLKTRLQEHIESHNYRKGDKHFKLSISMGIAIYDPEYPCFIDKLLSQADKLMYEQKRNKTMNRSVESIERSTESPALCAKCSIFNGRNRRGKESSLSIRGPLR
jgi:diguanylate cyclase (GGDEF)-like protein/PAS domain S-box-containing protein